MPVAIEHYIRSSNTDVLVIGAGPSGLMAAQALARLGVSVRVIDRRCYGTQYGNADGLQPRTLEIWQSYGMLQNFVPKSAPMHALVTYERGRDGEGLVRSTPSRNVVVDSRYPFELTACIDTIEETLRHSMEEAGAYQTQPVIPLSIDIIGKDHTSSGIEVTHPVKVFLSHLPKGSSQDLPNTRSHSTGSESNVASSKTEVVHAKYVIGADGAHSWVRHHLGIEMEGDQTEYVWGVMDVLVDTDFPDCRFKCVIQSSTGALIIIPREEEKIRIYVQLSAEDNVKMPNGRLDKSTLSPDIVRSQVLERAREGLRPYKVDFKHVFWCTIFAVPQKVATKFSYNNRIFIVGDACHTHSPKAGQGANVSMGDSHNLAWKLAYVMRGWARESLLDTYEIERRAHALDLIEFDKQIAMSLNGRTAAEYQRMLHKQNMFTSGIGVHYQSRLTDQEVNLCALGLKTGERLPPGCLVRLGDWQPMDLQDLAPSDGLFKLFIFPCDILHPDHRARLFEFMTILGEKMCPEVLDRISMFVVLNSVKESVHWKEVPPLVRSWKRVFVCEQPGIEDLYSKFGIASEGATVLVRPDGYISILTDVTAVGARQIAIFLEGL
ncbi:hypothetical protein K439DRAFT_1418443 [Ramaria rubella]|nr:hypothetical protein K439DRAFT_1418443 [Ramaria rubella]